MLSEFSNSHLSKFSKLPPFNWNNEYPENDSENFNNRYFRNPVLLENGAIYIGEWSFDIKYGKGI